MLRAKLLLVNLSLLCEGQKFVKIDICTKKLIFNYN